MQVQRISKISLSLHWLLPASGTCTSTETSYHRHPLLGGLDVAVSVLDQYPHARFFFAGVAAAAGREKRSHRPVVSGSEQTKAADADVQSAKDATTKRPVEQVSVLSSVLNCA